MYKLKIISNIYGMPTEAPKKIKSTQKMAIYDRCNWDYLNMEPLIVRRPTRISTVSFLI